jgi:CHAT domain-containing protein
MFGCLPIEGQTARGPNQAALQNEYDNGHFIVVVEKIAALSGHQRARPGTEVSAPVLVLNAKALMSLQRYDEASKSLDQALVSIEKQAGPMERRAEIHFMYSTLFRAKRDFRRALESAKTALSASPSDRQVRCEYYLSVGKILFSLGFDLSAVVWMERAEKLMDADTNPGLRFEIYRFLSLAWESKFHYAKAEVYGEKVVSMAEKTRFQYKYRLGLLDLANLKSASGQKRTAMALLEKGAKLSIAAIDHYLALNFLSRLMLNSLYDGNIEQAKNYLAQLEQMDTERRFAFEVLLGRAIIGAFQGQKAIAEKYFAEASQSKHYSDQIIAYWKISIANKDRNWEQLLNQSTELQKLSDKENFREDLPGIYLNLAKAFSGLGRIADAIDYAQRAIAMVDEIRPTSEASLSLGLVDTYHEAYRLLAELRLGEPEASFAFADYMKGRVLRDRIDNSILRQKGDVAPSQRFDIERLGERFVESNGTNKELQDEIERLERSITANIPSDKSELPNLQDLNRINSLGGSAIVSYLFTVDGKLIAYVWERNTPVRVVRLSLTEDEVARLAVETQRKIKNLLYFKKDAKEIYDKLLRPLSLKTKHLIVIPDKALWKIPFHASSADGEAYLIESTLVSYAPSVATLLEAVVQPTPKRSVIQSFANNSYGGRFLSRVNSEAVTAASIFGSRAIVNATPTDFLKKSAASDILHFSMHAELDAERPLQSFLAFKPTRGDSGKLTVADLLKIQLRKQCLVFLASCDTNTVVDGEGIVSLAWAMLGSGATSVVSSQWEADDRAAEKFTAKFYTAYSTGTSVAGSMQSAAIGMIREKSAGLHEPYYWAAFALYGDYR